MSSVIWKPKTEELDNEIKNTYQFLWDRANAAREWQGQQLLQPPTPSTPTFPQLAPLPQKQLAQPMEVDVPFWKRGLQVFAAPFEWVDKHLIKPAWGIVGTKTGFVPELERQPGEDYFDWKRRSWAAWENPGIDIKAPWSETPLRLDIRGIMELAPWLLVPGPGWVGGGTRAGAGIAGMLGKAGQVGKTVGRAVEYSPWGLAEKGIRTTFKGAARLGGRVSGKVGERIVGKIPEKPIEPEVAELTKAFKEVVNPKYEQFIKEGIPQLRARQLGGLEDVRGQFARGEISRQEYELLSSKALAGGVKGGYLADISGRFTEEAKEKLYQRVIKGAENGYIGYDTHNALVDLLANGVLPEPHHVKALAKILGNDFAQAVSQLRGVKPGQLDRIIDFLNFPRALLASTDLSGAGRQGWILSLMHPLKAPRWFGKQLKAFYSEKMSLEIDDVYRAHPEFNAYIKEGGYWAPLEKAAEAWTKEETFMSRFAHMFPLVRRSERAFLTYTNAARFESWLSTRNVMQAIGTEADKALMSRFVNLASGRGDLPKGLEKFAPAFNTMLFSTRLQAATLELPLQLGRMLASKNPYVRKEGAKALVTFLGAGASLMGLLKATGKAEIELDPRAGDFGKIIIGDRKTGTRLDVWRGYLQYTRFAAQFLTGERKSAYGNLNKAERSEIAQRFLQSKASPAAGLLVDLIKGENYMGEPLFEGTAGAIRTAQNRLMPIALQDVMDAMEQNGMNGVWTAAPATLGIGVLTYVNDFVRVQNKIARDLGFESWSQIDPKTRRQIENKSAELQVAKLKYDRQIMDTAWGDWNLAGDAIDEAFRENVERATEQYRQTKDGYQFRQKIADAYTARRGGYEARDKEPRFEDIVRRNNLPDTAESLVALGPEQMAIKVYNEAMYGDDMYDEFGEYRFEEADIRKEQLRQQLGEEMFNYVEEYRGLKYETLPPEFQELAKAKIVMRDYWGIANKMVRIFGQAFADSRKGQRIIQKQRQLLRKQNPELEYYYKLFYSRTT